MKKTRRLIWYIYPWFLLIILLPLFAIIWYTADSGRELFLERTRSDLLNQSRLLKNNFTRLLKQNKIDAVDQLCKETGALTPTRITVILPNGDVAGDSKKNPTSMDYHGNRPEIITAFKSGMGSSERYSATLGHQMMYVALRLTDDGNHLGVIRTAIALTAIDEALHTIEIRTAVGGMIIALLAALISLYVSRRISRPIEEMKRGAELYAAGDLSHRLHTPPSLELAGLAETMNSMAIQLEDRIQTVIRQRNEYEAVLSSMIEGVIAINKHEVVLNINQAALSMLKITSSQATGRTIQEAVRNRNFLNFASESLSGKKMEERDFELPDEKKRIINIRSMALHDALSAHIGSLIILNDVTQVRHLENIRKEFVANVSHEIKTPLTAIKGFVETLEQSVDEKDNDSLKFLGIIDRHVNRLNAIVEDLLAMARIEQINEKATLNLKKRRPRDVIENAVHVVQHKADLKDISIDIQTQDDGTHIKVDATLFEQALVNLLDNAIAYSPENERVTVTTALKNNEFIIQVSDRGIGISQQHLSRLFERFYRVDKARSRKHGGTGLGLAIVKHIVQAHGGRVSVESRPGEGSVFSVHLPVEL